MASQTRYARVDSPGQSDSTTQPVPDPLQYSNSLPDSSQPKTPLTAAWTSKRGIFGRSRNVNSQSFDELPPYGGYVDIGLDGGRPDKPST